ncbi:MAG: MmcQ/YjbR family DNA-binding protein [Clostridium sp.]|nr:MmcQ/YjbR family DNA-binding protein [Clostridium sp.]
MEQLKVDRAEILKYVKEKYKVDPDFPWSRTPKNAVLRHKDNSKWFALIIDVQKKKLGLEGEDKVDIINVKCDPMLIGSLRTSEGYMPAYHMNKENWISIMLDGTVEKDEICKLIDLSYNMTKDKLK